jgi:hypothetical protein
VADLVDPWRIGTTAIEASRKIAGRRRFADWSASRAGGIIGPQRRNSAHLHRPWRATSEYAIAAECHRFHADRTPWMACFAARVLCRLVALGLGGRTCVMFACGGTAVGCSKFKIEASGHLAMKIPLFLEKFSLIRV